MLTSILSAICALTLSSSVMASQADTTNVYIINGEKVTNFDGSQLVGKTVSDYRTMTSQSASNGNVSVTRTHVIRTDGKKIASVNSYSYTTTVSEGSTDVAKITIVGTGDETPVTTVQTMSGANGIEVYVDGKKSTVEKMGKIKPDKIASLTVYKAGSKETAKYTDSKDKNVIIVELKK